MRLASFGPQDSTINEDELDQFGMHEIGATDDDDLEDDETETTESEEGGIPTPKIAALDENEDIDELARLDRLEHELGDDGLLDFTDEDEDE